MAKRIKLPGRVESAEVGGIVTGANAIKDDEKGKVQSVINNEVDEELLRLQNEKQDMMTVDNSPTEGSENPVSSGGVFNAEKTLSDAIEAILLLIPSAASALNQLADKEFVASSIATSTATFQGTYNLVSDLHLSADATHEEIEVALGALGIDADANDYCFVQVPESDTSQEIRVTQRYKFNGTAWKYEYDLNNSGFTSEQWAAINSNITAALVAKLMGLPTSEVLAGLLGGKQDVLTFDEEPTAGSSNPVTSGGVYQANNDIIALINALDQAKQDVLTFDQSPVQGSSNPVTSGGVYDAIYLVQTVLATLGGSVETLQFSVSLLTEQVGILNTLYQALTQSDIIVGALPGTGVANRVYRVPGTSTYSDWMWYDGAWVKLAEYTTLDGYMYKGIATPNGSPAASAVKMFYFALTPGTYTNFGNLVVKYGINILKYDGANWTLENLGNSDGVFDVTEYSGSSFASLEALLSEENLSSLIPVGVRKGGMSIKFVLTSDNKYVQYRLMKNTWSTTVSDWQGIDDEPTAGSENLVQSGGVYKEINLFTYPLANKIIKELYIPNVDYTTIEKISIVIAALNSGSYQNVIVLRTINNENVYLYLKSFEDETSAIADIANMNGIIETNNKYYVLAADETLAGTRIIRAQCSLNRDVANIVNAPVIYSYIQNQEVVATKEDKSNKVSDWSQTPTDEKYPSEKLVYDKLATPLNENIHELNELKKNISVNLYDYSKIGVVKGTINATTGGLDDTFDAFTTGLIPVLPNQYYCLSERDTNSYKGIRCLMADGVTKLKVLIASTGEQPSKWRLPSEDGTSEVSNGQFKTPAEAAYVQIVLTPNNTVDIGTYYKIVLEYVGDTYNPNFVPTVFEPWERHTLVNDNNLQYPVLPLTRRVEALEEEDDTKSIKILCVGNSYTQDSMSYVPFVLKSIAPNVHLTIAIGFIGNSNLAQHTAYFSGETIEFDGARYTTDNGVYKKINIATEEEVFSGKYAFFKSVDGEPWETLNSKTVEELLANEQWDIITFQQSSAMSGDSWNIYYAPYIFKLHKSLFEKINYDTKIGWVSIHSKHSSTLTYDEFWKLISDNSYKVMCQTGTDILFPYGTAIENIRQISSVSSLGDGEDHNLMVDNSHLQEGIGPLAAAYTNSIVLLNAMGLEYKGVIAEPTRPDVTWVNENNIPGAHLGTSGVIGITDYNCLLAQIAATNAVKYPYAIVSPSVDSPYSNRILDGKLPYYKPTGGIPVSDIEPVVVVNTDMRGQVIEIMSALQSVGIISGYTVSEYPMVGTKIYQVSVTQ